METKQRPVITMQSDYDLSNYYQKQEACAIIYRIAAQTDGRLANALMSAQLPHGWSPKRDLRTKEGKEFAAAERAMWEALTRYDNARLAAKAKQATTT